MGIISDKQQRMAQNFRMTETAKECKKMNEMKATRRTGLLGSTCVENYKGGLKWVLRIREFISTTKQFYLENVNSDKITNSSELATHSSLSHNTRIFKLAGRYLAASGENKLLSICGHRRPRSTCLSAIRSVPY